MGACWGSTKGGLFLAEFCKFWGWFLFVPGNYFDSVGAYGSGAVRAYNLADGQMSWELLTSYPCNSYPSVGHLKGYASDLAVVVTPGRFVGAPAMPGSVLALKAETGEVLWEYQAPPYTGPAFQAAGDVEGMAIRDAEGVQSVSWLYEL